LVTPAANHGSVSKEGWAKKAVGEDWIRVDFGISANDLHAQQKTATTTQNDPTFLAAPDMGQMDFEVSALVIAGLILD
jgi:hypothetical protein